MQPIRTLADILDDGAVVSVERQRRLAELVGRDAPFGEHWDYELDAGAEVALTAADGRLVVAFDGLGRVASMDARLATD